MVTPELHPDPTAGNVEPPSSVPTPSESNAGSGKITHQLDHDDSAASPPAAKRRRTGSVSESAPEASNNATAQPEENPEQQAQDAAAQASTVPATATDSKGEVNGTPETTDQGKVNAPPSAATALGQDPLAPDVAEVISNIMSYSERVEEQYNQQLKSAGESQPMVFIKANSHLKTQSLPILDNLSSQILTLLAQSSYQDLTSIVSEPNSESGQAYSTMRSLFDHTKNVYTTKGSFLSPRELDLTEPGQVDIIRKANMASFVSSIFGSQEIGFSELDENFLETFVPEGSRLLKVQGALFLELKTQAYIAAMNSGKRSKTELLHELFPDDLEDRLLARRPGTKQLAPSETDFIKRAYSRRDILLNEVNNPEAAAALPEKYRWEDFLRDLSAYVSKNFEAISHQQTKKPNKGRPSTNGDTQESRSGPLEGQFSVVPNPPEIQAPRSAAHSDLVARAARAAQIALQGQRQGARNAAKAAQQQNQQSQTQPSQAAPQQPPRAQPVQPPQQPQQVQQPQPPQPQIFQQQQQQQVQQQQVQQQQVQQQQAQQQQVQQQQVQQQQVQQPQQPQAPPPQHQPPPQLQQHQFQSQFQQQPPKQHQTPHPPPQPAPMYQHGIPQPPQRPGAHPTFHQGPMTTTFPAQPTQPAQPAQITFHQNPPLHFQQYNPASAAASITARAHAAAANYGYMPGVPHYSQSQPTQILYERARLATTAKSSPTNRRAGLPSQRRPWTTEEENALMAGLDRVKGPHWSQILAMFGPGGTINESLKDRNQVQLKDKARNLKLFFLKSGIEVPYYLKFVTGELKTRAPAQAAKHEARERQRRLGDEDKAHVEGIEGMMALAGAHSASMSADSGSNSMAGSPGLVQHQDPQQSQDQTMEQALIQSLTQEVKQEGMHHEQAQNMIDPSLQNPQ